MWCEKFVELTQLELRNTQKVLESHGINMVFGKTRRYGQISRKFYLGIWRLATVNPITTTWHPSYKRRLPHFFGLTLSTSHLCLWRHCQQICTSWFVLFKGGRNQFQDKQKLNQFSNIPVALDQTESSQMECT